MLQVNDGTGFIERHVFGAKPSPLVLAVKDPSPCSAMLSRLGLRITEAGDKSDEFHGYPMLWLDHYLRGVTFDLLDAYECSFTDVKSNPANMTMGSLMVIYRLVVSIFSISIYAMLLQRTLAWLRGRAGPA